MYDAGEFVEPGGCSGGQDQLKQDLVKLHELRVCDWLRSLSFRIPDSDVIVVATKCDLVAGAATSLAGRVEPAIRKWLQHWSEAEMTAVRVEDGVSLTSCVPTSVSKEHGKDSARETEDPGKSTWACDWCEDTRDRCIPSLLRRVMYKSKGDLRGATMVLPRTWNIALTALDALGSGRRVFLRCWYIPSLLFCAVFV